MAEYIKQKIQGGKKSICDSCTHRNVCKAIDNQPCTECNHYQCTADVEQVQQWIPVTERLPKYRDGKVLAFTQYGYSICERTRNGRWKGQHSNWITHWAYLPPPPETEYGYLQNVMTNADHIRNMTDKELAEFFCPDTPRNYPWCHPIGKTNRSKAACRRCMSKWLQQPVKEEQ